MVPKVENAIYAKDYMPIACSSVIYKLISKILTQRLQSVVNEVVNCAKTGFILDRNIGDNTLLTTELIRGYNRSHIFLRCVIKVDIK